RDPAGELDLAVPTCSNDRPDENAPRPGEDPRAADDDVGQSRAEGRIDARIRLAAAGTRAGEVARGLLAEDRSLREVDCPDVACSAAAGEEGQCLVGKAVGVDDAAPTVGVVEIRTQRLAISHDGLGERHSYRDGVRRG